MKIKNPLSLLSLGFGSGLSPLAPGTFGSLLALILYYFFADPHIQSFFDILGFTLFLIFSFLIGLYIYPRTIEVEEEDPGSFVWDEFVGMWIACLPVTFLGNNDLWFLVSFFLFRILDIWKPGPIGFFDKNHSAFNVMMDDVVAGLLSSLVVAFLLITIY